jgi:hypothetical protein
MIQPEGCRQLAPKEKLPVVTKKVFGLGLKLLSKKIHEYIDDKIATVNQRVDDVADGAFVYGTTAATSFAAESTTRIIGLVPSNGNTSDIIGGIYTVKSAGLYYISLDAKSDAFEEAIPEITISMMIGDDAEATVSLTDTKNIPGLSAMLPLTEAQTVKFVATAPDALEYPAGIKFVIVRITNG